MISFRGLVKIIFLFKGVNRYVFGCKLYKKRFAVFGC